MAFLNWPIKTYILKIWWSAMWRVQLLYVTQPCLHTLMRTRLSANHSARTILVILQFLVVIPGFLSQDKIFNQLVSFVKNDTLF